MVWLVHWFAKKLMSVVRRYFFVRNVQRLLITQHVLGYQGEWIAKSSHKILTTETSTLHLHLLLLLLFSLSLFLCFKENSVEMLFLDFVFFYFHFLHRLRTRQCPTTTTTTTTIWLNFLNHIFTIIFIWILCLFNARNSIKITLHSPIFFSFFLYFAP